MKKPHCIQLIFFFIHDDIDIWFGEFKPYVEQLWNKGFSSGCYDWWRSRYSDFLGMEHQAKNRDEWEYRRQRQTSFQQIWDRYHTLLRNNKHLNTQL